jgi:hypothetical protein
MINKDANFRLGYTDYSFLDAKFPLLTKSFGFLNDLFPFPSILDADDPVFNLHLTNIPFNVILSSVLGSSLWSFG